MPAITDRTIIQTGVFLSSEGVGEGANGLVPFCSISFPK